MSAEQEFVVHRNQKFGWCMYLEPDHKNCQMRFSFYEKDYQCSCECHEGKDFPPLVPGKNMIPVKPEKPERAARGTRKKK